MKKHFLIDHIDPMGQGVFKEDDSVFFIPKTLPEEIGTFKVLQSKKGVHFGELIEIQKASPERIVPACAHFNFCPGCQYLHTDYSKELQYKQISLLRHFKKWGDISPYLETIASPERLHYRNRIQLHYNLSKNLLGIYDAKNLKIIPILGCKIFVKELQSAFIELATTWQKKAQNFGKNEGHVELYWHDQKIYENWNKPYADGAFTQVNQNMNSLLQERIQSFVSPLSPSSILELFAGDGNLTKHLGIKTTSFDYYTSPKEARENHHFHSLDLYSEKALEEVKKIWGSSSTPLLLIDPPRTGFKNLSEWMDDLNVNRLLYVSCHPATLARDLEPLKEKYHLKNILLMDLFPSTSHYETVVLLERAALI